jgi:hypothetical protein
MLETQKGPWERRLLVWGAIYLVGAVVVIVAAYYFDVYTESDVFCGLVCHANVPQGITSEVSAHANVECGTCHIGPGLLPKVSSKIFGVGELYKQLTNTYERPIAPPVARLRSARDICQQCHWPDRFHENQARLFTHFASDEENSATHTFFVLRLGQGGDPQESAQGIHWHIENLTYASLDPQNQEIPWIGAVRDGQPVAYQAIDSGLTAEALERLPRRQMDCLDCHNRAAHNFRNPERSLDEALAAGRIDRSLPFVKREALKLLSASYPTQEAGLKAMENLEEFYRSQYPGLYSDQRQAVERAVDVIQDIYGHTVFPDMNLNWQSYPDNLGHTDFSGCFRCHDGKHVNAQGEVIPLNCNLCHSVPVVAEADQEPSLPLVFDFVAQTGREPDSHRETSFIWDHRILANESCADCHGPIEYGTDNSSFCANGVCHGQEWPKLALEADFSHPPIPLAGQHARVQCNECHQGVERPPTEDCTACHRPEPEPHFGSQCSQCHTVDGWQKSADSWITDAPSNPHGVETVDCLLCHGESGLEPAPDTHVEIPAELCVFCHGSATIVMVPIIPHAVGGPDTCITCHGEGALKPESALHRSIPSASCLDCHRSGPIEAVVIPHVVEGRGNCLVCHDEGKLKPVPAGHKGWTNEFCLTCHK